MKKIKFFIPIIALALFSCSDYLDINDNPNNVHFENVPPRLMLPGAMTNTFRTQAINMNEMGNILMNTWAGNVNSYASPYSKQYKLTVDNTFYNAIWDGLYRSVGNFDVIIKYQNVDHQQDNFVAISKIMKAHYLQYIVDLYGKAPFSQAFLGQANLSPVYDDDFQIYKDLITGLEEGRATIANPNVNAIDAAGADVIFHGDKDKWVRFANTVELRMLMRMSNTTSAAVQTYRDAKLASIAAGPFVTTDVTINPGYDGSTDDKQNPFYGNFVFNTSAAATGRTLIVASGHIARILNGGVAVIGGVPTAETNPNYSRYAGGIDSRRGRMFMLVTPVSGGPSNVFGVVQGNSQGDTPGPGTSRVSKIGAGVTNSISTSNSLASAANAARSAAASAKPGIVMLQSESLFLQAEAALRWPALFSAAQGNFEAGITSSFAFYSNAVPTSPALNPATYLTYISTKPGVGWPASATFDTKLEAIMFQKWLALTQIHGLENYIDYIRTGYPWTPLASSVEQPNKPKRLMYPISEFVANSGNVPQLTDSDLFNVTTKSPFWLQ
ncbi:SusD/RagB family nutrient-binding outer membrane lipoprotein [Flavobacterium rhamnosiphilum]|uniref:SusD/RagB family nutrient-binding outer membrane lipoprotein n=1 Tax=Flavobacterium rhamnosiphilum TaxID=2541724 RepID=A0A4R5F4G7_9FLAO|nr:SusD/RagB family nutrient-binding outer membrane lipoprotein [Flavobacterium rhamnosiphilum]TDE42494.1 SusD/RagB family nutrient-binding outer membrane lipoprotein [Flavobacterium rhamnosiphilum]